MARAWTVERPNHQNPNGRTTFATPKTRPQKTGVLTTRAGADGVADAVLTRLRTVRSLRVRVATRVLCERLSAFERAEVPCMPVPREMRGSGIGVDEHPTHRIQHLRRRPSPVFSDRVDLDWFADVLQPRSSECRSDHVRM